MERINGDQGDCERIMRTLEKPDTPILTGKRIYDDYARPHEARSKDGRTLSQEARIKAETITSDRR